MRTITSPMMALALASVTIVVLPTAAASQTAQKKRTPKAKPNPMQGALDMARMMESGGAVGCPNGALSGRTARVAERIRARETNCPDTAQAIAPLHPALSRTWLVGLWGLDGCNAPPFYKRVRADGRFSSADERGTWQLQTGQALPVLNLSFRRDGDAPDRAPRTMGLALTRDGDNRMQLNVGWWTRCSRNPDAALS